MQHIPILDLFAGPGGLGEGFSALRRNHKPAFKLALSIEKDPFAHRTLELRAFFRQFPDGRAPEEYYNYLAGNITRDHLFDKFPIEAAQAIEEAWHATLGGDDFNSDMVDRRIRKALGGRSQWLLIGGPPCQAYSLVGRSKIIGEKGIKMYEADHRHFLYKEYLRIIAVHRPPVFVMENVKGLLSAKVNNEDMISTILRDLQNPLEAYFEHRAYRQHESLSYKLFSLVVPTDDSPAAFVPSKFIVRTENHGVPQARHRLILLGVANKMVPPRLLEQRKKVSLQEVIDDLPRLRSGLSKEPDSPKAWREVLLAIRNVGWLHDPKVSSDLRNEIFTLLGELDEELNRGAE